ncbi:MAG TPA: murein biosynthesis integral membrane protein MurJ [Verrucomicrobiae bacterium]|jgi:putative peptidoglycan lipid II flippase|nr:murein biosynthesis integral membrane protein MurJ [Verrucomicrobiae bacterium]
MTQAEPAASPASRSSVARNAGVVSAAIMASRVLGLVRDQVFAALFGAGLQYDAFLTAFRIPNLLRDLFAEGALSAAFVTTFSQVLVTKGEAEAFRLSNRVATLLMLILGAITLTGWFAAPAVVQLLAPGFFDVPGKAGLTIHLTRIMIPFLLFVALAAKAMGILNAMHRFGVPAMASAFFNIGSIVGGLFLGFAVGPTLGLGAIEGMAYGTLFGGFLQFAVQWPSLRKVGFRYRPMLSFRDPGVRQIIALMGPAIIGAAAVQINIFVNSNFASSIIDPATGRVGNGPVSWLNYAFRFVQFPIGAFGVAISTATLPLISAAAARREVGEFRRTLAHSLGLIFLLCIPSAAGLIVLRQPIVGLVFEHGKFTAFDTGQTAAALAAYSIGLAGYGGVKVLAPAFYALDDALTPMLVSLGSVVINYVINYLLVGPLGHVGLACSTSAVAIVNFVLLLALMRRRLGRLEGKRLVSSLVRISAATAVMAAAVWLTAIAPASYVRLYGFKLYLAQVAIGLTSAAAVFYAACRAIGVDEFNEALAAIGGRFRRRAAASLAP